MRTDRQQFWPPRLADAERAVRAAGLGATGQPRRGAPDRTDQLRFVRRAPAGFEAPYGRWGLVPARMSLDEARRYATFNARVESLEDKPMFQAAFQSQRCVIPLAGFWE